MKMILHIYLEAIKLNIKDIKYFLTICLHHYGVLQHMMENNV